MADNFDNYSMKVQARVDLPSNKDIDAQIRKLEKSISKLKVSGQFDDTALRNLTNQLNTLKANITTANFSPTALTELTNQVNRALQNINIGNINVGNVNNQAQQVGQQIGNNIGQQITQSISSAIQKGTMKSVDGTKDLSKYIPNGNLLQNDVAKQALKDFQALGVGIVTVKEEMKNIDGKNLLNGFTINIKNAKGEVESLRYALKDIEGKTGKMFQYVGGSINDNGVIQQMNTISAKADSLQTKLDKMKASYSDLNASRPIKDSGNISALSQQYDKVAQAIENVRNADNSTFSSMVSNAQKEITTLETMVAQFRNAENVATQMKSVDISSGIAQAQERLGKLKANASGFEQMTETIRKLDTAIESVGDKSSLDAFINDLRTAETQLGRVKAEAKQLENVNKIQLSTDITKIENDYKRFGIVSQEVENNLKELKIARENALKAEGTDRASAEIEKYNQKLAETKSSWKELQATQVSANQRTSQMTGMQEWMRKNQRATKLCGDQVQKLIQECQTCDKVRFDQIKNEFKELQTEAGKAGKLGNTLWGSIVEQGKSFIQWTGVSGLVMSVWHSFKQGATNVKELGDSLLELEKVSDLSASGLEKVREEAYKLGDTVGKTGRQVIDATTEFKRAGYDMQDSLDMSKAALVMTNVAEGITETSDAAGTLISVLKGFNMAESEAMSIVDMMNSTSNQSPIGFDQLAEGLERTSGTLAQSGNTIQETIGLLTAGYAQLRNVEKISQGLITISARIRGVGEDGETIDGLSAKMSEDFGKIGIAVENADGSLRSIYQIAQDYSKVLPTLTDKQKQYYAELAAGKHQVTVWNAIVQQFKDAENATAQAIDSVGSASEENQKYLESISGKISIFQSAVEHLSSTVIDSDLLKFFVDLGTTGVKAVDGLINSIGTLGTIGLIGGGILGVKNAG